MYERRSRLPSYQQGELLKMVVVGATARAMNCLEKWKLMRVTSVGCVRVNEDVVQQAKWQYSAY